LSGAEKKSWTRPLRTALTQELHELDYFITRAWLIAGLLGLLASLVVAATVSPSVGKACAALSTLYALIYGSMLLRLRRGPLTSTAENVMAVLESTIPWGFFFALYLAQGAGYALASWVPPMVYTLVIFGLTVRLRLHAAMVTGLISAACFLGLYFGVVADALPPVLQGMPVYGRGMQISRALSLIAGGVLAVVTGRGLVTALGRAEATLRERELFGKYRLLSEIAKGGMATVFEAVYCPEGGFERRVAVKRIHPHLAEQERFVEFFRSEAAISSRLAHPNIVQVLDFGRAGDRYFLSMEFVDGMTLAAFLRAARRVGRPPSPALVGAVGRGILQGLVHAHEVARSADGALLRVVHRDLCPANVLLSRTGDVKITDFGVARALRDSAAAQTKTVVGHLAYVAPEQAQGDPVDPRADLFATGVILWELLALGPLFARESDVATLAALMHEEPPPISQRRPELSSGWDDFFRRALARDPARRFASARQMLTALDRLVGGEDPQAVAELERWVREHTGEAPVEDPTHVDVDGEVTQIRA